MLVILFSGFGADKVNERRKKSFEDILRLVGQKNLNFFVLGYSVHDDQEHSIIRYPEAKHRVPIISLHELLRGSEFVDEKGLLRPIYRNSAGSHPDDAGYYVEAVNLFNWFCEQEKFGLKSEMKENGRSLDEYIKSLELRYQDLRGIVHKFIPSDLGNFQFAPKAGRLIYTMHNLLNMLREYPGCEHYQAEYDLIEKLSSLVFFKNSYVQSYLMESYFVSIGLSQYSTVVPIPEKVRLFFAVLMTTVEKNLANRVMVESKIRNSSFPVRDLKVDFYIDTQMYPLDLCLRFMEQTGFSQAELSTKEAWEHFFKIPHAAFSSLQMPEACKIYTE